MGVAIEGAPGIGKTTVWRHAVERARARGYLVLIASPSEADAALAFSGLGDLFAGVDVELLDGLPDPQRRALLAALFLREASEAPFDLDALPRVHEVSGGNPLHVVALGAELRRVRAAVALSGSYRSRARSPTRSRGGLSACAPVSRHRCSRSRRSADPTLALLGAVVEGFDVGELETNLRADVLEISGDKVRFTHPLLASVRYASVPVPERRELHLRLAAVVDDTEQRALHLALGSEMPNDDIAGQIERAGDLPARRGAPDAAAELLEHAIRLTPIDRQAERWSRINRAAELHLAAGDFAPAGYSGQSIRSSSRPVRARSVCFAQPARSKSAR